MSSSLSREYRSAKSLSQLLDTGILLLRHADAAPVPMDEAKAREGAELRADIAHALRLVTQTVGLAEIPSIAVERQLVPWQLVTDLRSTKGEDLDEYLTKLEEVADKVDDPASSLNDEDFSVLDELSATAEAEATNAFSRMTLEQ